MQLRKHSLCGCGCAVFHWNMCCALAVTCADRTYTKQATSVCRADAQITIGGAGNLWYLIAARG